MSNIATPLQGIKNYTLRVEDTLLEEHLQNYPLAPRPIKNRWYHINHRTYVLMGIFMIFLMAYSPYLLVQIIIGLQQLYVQNPTNVLIFLSLQDFGLHCLVYSRSRMGFTLSGLSQFMRGGLGKVKENQRLQNSQSLLVVQHLLLSLAFGVF